eukprot:761975-Hanusia_phi.AAC.3
MIVVTLSHWQSYSDPESSGSDPRGSLCRALPRSTIVPSVPRMIRADPTHRVRLDPGSDHKLCVTVRWHSWHTVPGPGHGDGLAAPAARRTVRSDPITLRLRLSDPRPAGVTSPRRRRGVSDAGHRNGLKSLENIVRQCRMLHALRSDPGSDRRQSECGSPCSLAGGNGFRSLASAAVPGTVRRCGPITVRLPGQAGRVYHLD